MANEAEKIHHQTAALVDDDDSPDLVGASPAEQLIDACRHDNVELMDKVLAEMRAAGASDDDVAKLLNNTKTVMGRYLYHEAASRDDVIDHLLDQPGFECDPVSPDDGDTPLHSAVRWINQEGPRNWEFGCELIAMMLEAGSSSRAKNKAKMTAEQLVDPANKGLKEVFEKHEYISMMKGDFVDADDLAGGGNEKGGDSRQQKNDTGGGSGGLSNVIGSAWGSKSSAGKPQHDDEFSGSDEEERAEWEWKKAQRK